MKTMGLNCRCDAVELTISAGPVAQIYCHCEDCRTAHGAAYVAASIHPAQAVEITRGQLRAITVKSTPRFGCATCGTHLFSKIAGPGLRSVNGFLLPKTEFKPQMHVQCRDAILPVVDTLPHYKGFPAAFGGSEEFVDW